MAHKKPKICTEIKEFQIYILLFARAKDFYVGITAQKELYDTLKDHCNKKINRTAQYIGEYIDGGNVPQIFLLEKIKNTKVKVFSRSIAWAKLITAQGYGCINGETFVEYTADLYDEAQKNFKEIKDINLSEILSDKNSLYPNYKPGRKQKAGKSSYKINLSFSEEDFRLIEQRAVESGMTKTAFVRQMALQGKIITLDYAVSGEYLKEIQRMIDSLRRITMNIYYLKQYFPQDLKIVQEAEDMVTEHYKKFLRMTIKTNKLIVKQMNSR